MQYLLLIRADENAEANLTEEDVASLVERYGQVAEEADKAGVLKAAHRLRPSGDATTLRAPKGDLVITDGPFAETKEQLGGFYLVDVPDLDAAIGWARKLPAVEYGSVEVRPIWED